jgi:phosphoribosylformylglycinamidine (FGAM) synthase-like amidotransferase family enzyme
VITIDGTRIKANASMDQNRDRVLGLMAHAERLCDRTSWQM